MTTPKVSVITCFLNVAPFIEAAVQSVLDQTYTEWELILIDDGSTDGSTEIAQKLALQHPGKIIYLHHDGHVNKGSSASRNLGMEKASGDLIAFLDADDIYAPEYLMNQVQTLQQQQVTMVCEATNYWYSWNTQYEDVLIPVGAAPGKCYTPPQLMLELYPLGTGAAPCVCAILIKKSAIEKYGGFDESFTGMYDEQILLSRLYLNEPIYISDTCNNHYRQRANSLVGTSKQDRNAYFRVRKAYLEWLEKYLQQTGNTDQSVHAQLEKAFTRYRRPFLYFFTGTIPETMQIAQRKFHTLKYRISSILAHKTTAEESFSNK